MAWDGYNEVGNKAFDFKIWVAKLFVLCHVTFQRVGARRGRDNLEEALRKEVILSGELFWEGGDSTREGIFFFRRAFTVMGQVIK